jgi:hypothetical protein
MRAVLTSIFLFAAMPASAVTVTVIDVPGARLTYAQSISPSGIVGGGYAPAGSDPCGQECGYLRMPDGTFQTFPVFGATNVSIDGVLDDGTAVGSYILKRRNRGFARTPDGALTDVFFHKLNTEMRYLNASGTALGSATGVSGDFMFLRAPDRKAKILTIQGCDDATFPAGINAAGTIAGSCIRQGALNVFLRTPDGQVTFLERRGWQHMGVGAIDDTGSIAGAYVDAHSGIEHGFVRDEAGKYRSFDLPGGASSLEIVATIVVGGDRQVVGYFTGSSDSRYYGFIHHGDGSNEVFDVSGGQLSESGTFVSGITPSGVVVGSYFDDGFGIHGYIRTP